MGVSRNPFYLGVSLDPFSHSHDSIPLIPATFCLGRFGSNHFEAGQDTSLWGWQDPFSLGSGHDPAGFGASKA
jgi:hypothetical protein